METLNFLMQGFDVATRPTNLLVALFGAFVGTIVGLLPGWDRSTGGPAAAAGACPRPATGNRVDPAGSGTWAVSTAAASRRFCSTYRVMPLR